MLDLDTELGRRADRRLRDELVVWFTTVRADGMPVPVPVWFLWDGETVLIYSQPRRGKLRNLDHTANASLSFNCTPTGGDVLVLTGQAHVDEAAPSADRNRPYVEKYREEIASLGADPASFAADYAVAVRFVPDRVTGF